MTMLHSTALRCVAFYLLIPNAVVFSAFLLCVSLLIAPLLYLQYDTLAIYLYIHNPCSRKAQPIR